jgi:hypothetical protein
VYVCVCISIGMGIYVCVCMCAYVCVRVCVCVCLHVCARVFMCMCVHVYMHACICVCEFVPLNMQPLIKHPLRFCLIYFYGGVPTSTGDRVNVGGPRVIS